MNITTNLKSEIWLIRKDMMEIRKIRKKKTRKLSLSHVTNSSETVAFRRTIPPFGARLNGLLYHHSYQKKKKIRKGMCCAFLYLFFILLLRAFGWPFQPSHSRLPLICLAASVAQSRRLIAMQDESPSFKPSQFLIILVHYY